MSLTTNKTIIKNKEIKKHVKISNKKIQSYIKTNKNNKKINIIKISIKESKINSIIFT